VRRRTEQPGIHGIVTLTEVIAPDDYATVDVEGVTLRARLALDSGLRVGDLVDVRLTAGQVLLFDPESGERLAAPVAESGAPDLAAAAR
jgi:multiple sugar transport system ATP-binding protein